ncbi:MAG: ROK family transcriptional regulator [Pseudomonadota bacterium]
MAEANPASILDAIRRVGPLARVALADRLGLSAATVTTVTAELIEAGLVREEAPPPGPGTARRGRPRVLLSADPGAMTLLGAKIADRHVRVVVTDFCGGVLGQAIQPFAVPADAAAVEAALAEAVDAALDQAGTGLAEIAALGVGLPGFVDQASGTIHWSPAFAAPRTGLAEQFSRRFGCPVFLDNDANLATLAELRFGFGRGQSDFLVVTIENGVGLGIVLGGALFRGARGLGAEFGHTKVRQDGALCRCGQRGCLEAYVADYALVREAEVLQPDGAADPMAALYARAAAGDPMVRQLLARAGRLFGLGLANLVNIFDPPLVILSGERMRFDHLFTPEVVAEMRAHMIHTNRPAPEIKVHRWGDLLWARGAAVLAMDGVLRRPAPPRALMQGPKALALTDR